MGNFYYPYSPYQQETRVCIDRGLHFSTQQARLPYGWPLPSPQPGSSDTSQEDEKIFDHQLKQHKFKYVETNEEVETDETVLNTFWGGFHTSNVASGEYAKVVNGIKTTMDNCARKECAL